MADPGPFGTKAKRRWWKLLALALLSPVVAIAAVPWLLTTPPAQRWLLARANRALAPGRISWATLRFSWFGPTRLTAAAIRDPGGHPVATAERATLDRTLGQLLFDKPRYGTLTLDGAALDVERRADGTVDLYEAIKPMITGDPRTQFRVVIVGGRLRFRSPGLPEPVLADRADVDVAIGPAPSPVSWKLDLRRSPTRPDASPGTLAISGRYERWWEPEPKGMGTPHDLVLKLESKGWAWRVDAAGVDARGVLDGTLAASRRSGRWESDGDARLAALEATGPRLEGDRLRLDRLAGAWDVAQSGRGGNWSIRRLDLESPVASLKTTGTLPAPPGGTAGIDGTLDLAALAGQLPHTLRLREGIALEKGTARVHVDARTGPAPGSGTADDVSTWDVAADVTDLVARVRDGGRPLTLESPASLAARVQNRAGAWSLGRLAVRTAFLDAGGEGSLDDGVRWTARVDLGGFQRAFRDLIDFGTLELAGKGDLSGDYRRRGSDYGGHASAVVRGLRVAGLDSGTFARDEVRLDATLDGPAGAEGLPRAWEHARLVVNSGPVAADLAATPRDGTLTVSGPLDVSGRAGRVEAVATGRRSDVGLAFDQVSLALRPEGEGHHGEPVAIVGRGGYDRARGELTLTPVDAAEDPGAIALAGDGLRVVGIGREGALRVDGTLAGDLAAVARLARSWGLPVPAGPAGRWSARGALRQVDDGWQVGAKLDVPDLILAGKPPAGRRSEGPLGLSVRANYQPGKDRIELSECALSSRYGALEVSGQLVEPLGVRRVDLLGTLSPDWGAINSLLAERVEPGARVAGRPRPIRLSGSFSGRTFKDWLKAADGEIGIDLRGADIFGMSLGPAPIVLHAGEGRLGLETIDTTLNGGRIHLEPSIELDDEAGAVLRLGPESRVVNARINDEVSHRVLAFVAPVLDNATRARGFISVQLQGATFPLGGPAERTATVDGAVQFQDAEFVAGPIADQLFDLLRLERRPALKLSEPVSLRIADHRVYQDGLKIPIGQLSTIEMRGWVDFDRRLNMTASVPILPTMLQDRPLLGGLFGGLSVNVPIRGTLGKPEVDRGAFNLAMQDLGKDLLDRTGVGGAGDLLRQIFPPRAPNAAPPPPPPTLEERRARRQERRRERQERRTQPTP